jgi:hypothetical protein
MEWLLQGELRQVMSLASFRALYDLPPEFGLASFVRKDYTRAGRIGGAGTALQTVRTALVNAIPSETPPGGWMAFIFTLQRQFRQQLYAVNAYVGLQPSEIDYAVTGCCDVLRMFVYEIGCAQLAGNPLPEFHQIYFTWFNSNIHLSRPVAHYVYGDYLWQIQVISNPFGRAGLAIETHADTHYVYDPELACPAAGFVSSLLRDIADTILRATERAEQLGCKNESSAS